MNPPDEGRGIRAGVRRLFRLGLHGRRFARGDADAELESFLDARIEHLVARGLSREQARTEAIRRLGATSLDDARNLLHHSAELRERRMDLREQLDATASDLRYAVRGLIAKPAFTAAVILTLSLGIGSATGVFSIVNGVLLRALPYPEPDRLVRIYETAPPAQGGELRSIAIPTLGDWRRHLRLFDGIALYGPNSFDLSGRDRPEKIQGATTTASLFTILGARPQLGRIFSADEERPGGPLVVILSHRLWQRRFGGDSSIVGQAVRLDRQAFTVIGVMPPGFAYPTSAEMWASIGTDHEFDARDARHMSALARLKPNVSVGAATAELLTEERQLAQTDPKIYAERGIRVIPLDERIVGDVRPALTMLAGAVLFVLLGACVNVANLLLARGTARRGEIALRTALGATRGRIARQLLVESSVLFVVAGVIGLAVAAAIVRGVHGLGADVLPRSDSIQLDGSVVLFALVATAFAATVFGLLPAMQASAVAPGVALIDGGRISSGGRRGGRLRSGLIVTETALAAMLLVGAGLLVRSLDRLGRVDPGFRIESVLAFDISVRSDQAADPARVIAFFKGLRERIALIPGVHGVGMASRLPLSGADHSNGFRLESDPSSATIERSAQDRSVSPGFFHALGVRVVQGREFTDADGASAEPVIVVNRAFADRYFPGQSAVGHRIVPSRAGNVPRHIVGVVADTKQFGLDAPAEPEFYIPHAQDPWSFLSVTVRADGDPRALLPPIRDAVASLDRELPLGDVRTIGQMASESGAQRRVVAIVLSAFAVAAYLLAAIGLYGVIAYAVAERTAEIGVRMALGAQRLDIARMVLWRAISLAAVGAVIGLLAAVPLTHSLRGLLFGVTQSDPTTFIAVGVLLPIVAIVASLIPARRAVRIDPVSAMRR